MIANNFRLSRVSHPRATLWAVALLIIVFVGFGVLAQASVPINHSSGLNLDSLNLDSFTQSSSLLAELTAVLR